MKAKSIKMKYGCHYSNNLLEIDKIYIDGCANPGFYDKEMVHNYLKKNPNDYIVVDIYPFPRLIPAVSINGEKYVRSTPDYTNTDNLLRLPRK